jgi:DNA polymerase III delta prime subunit
MYAPEVLFNPEQDEAIKRVQMWKAALEASKEPMDKTYILKVLSRTIKRDEENKLITFYSMVLNYSFEDQQNLMFSAPSSTGKSHIALECAKNFPKEDVDKRGYTSKKAFFHRNSVLQTLDGKKLDNRVDYVRNQLTEWEEKNLKPYAPEYGDNSSEAIKQRRAVSRWRENRKAKQRRLREEWDALEKIFCVNLERRILIFKDAPDDQVLEPLRSLLSHDEKELISEITDKNTSGGNQTKKIKLIGYPTIVFCQAAFSPNEQERTRVFILSPEMDQDKLNESLDLQAENLQDRDTFKEKMDSGLNGAALKARIELIKSMNIQQVIIKPESMKNLLMWFKTGTKDQPRELSPRDMRDFPRVIAMAKGHALFNLPQREYTPNGNLIAKQEDIEAAIELLGKTLRANQLELPPYIYDWWLNDLSILFEASSDEGITRMDFNQAYYAKFKSRLSEKQRKNIIKLLEEAGFIEERTDPVDKRTTRLYSTGVVDINGERFMPPKAPEAY